jgi:hypothetical protein
VPRDGIAECVGALPCLPTTAVTCVPKQSGPTAQVPQSHKLRRKHHLVNLLPAQIEIRKGLPFDVNLMSRPLLSADEQAAAWTKAFGAY